MIVLVQMSIIVKTIINYHAVLVVFKFDMKADVSFCRSNEWMKVHDSFSASSLPKASSNGEQLLWLYLWQSQPAINLL